MIVYLHDHLTGKWLGNFDIAAVPSSRVGQYIWYGRVAYEPTIVWYLPGGEVVIEVTKLHLGGKPPSEGRAGE